MRLVSEVDGGIFQSRRREKLRGKWEEQGFWYKNPEWKERRTFSFAFVMGGETLSKFGEGEQSGKLWFLSF